MDTPTNSKPPGWRSCGGLALIGFLAIATFFLSTDKDQPLASGELAYDLGRAIAMPGFILVTGACPGLPYECARASRVAGGLSVGISPALSLDEQGPETAVVRYRCRGAL